MARELLSEQQVESALPSVEWRRDGRELTKTVVLADFRAAMDFVEQVADLSEARNHHPDISISWNRVGLRLTTHDSGGLTSLDFDLARAIDALLLS